MKRIRSKEKEIPREAPSDSLAASLKRALRLTNSKPLMQSGSQVYLWKSAGPYIPYDDLAGVRLQPARLERQRIEAIRLAQHLTYA